MPSHDHGRHANDKHAGHSVAMFRRKFWLTLLLTIPTMLLEGDSQAFGFTPLDFLR